jgi:uncharacterized phage-like protein YoqJ
MIITFTGHRNFNKNKLAAEAHPERLDINPYVHSWLRDIQTKHPQAEIRVGGALGTDMIVAKQALSMKLSVHVFLPCPVEQFTTKWKPWSIHQLQRIIERATEVTIVCKEWHKKCYLRRDEQMLVGANILIGFYDGRNYGGTRYTMTYAYRRGIAVYDGFDKQEWSPRKDHQGFYQSDADRPEEDEPEVKRSYLREIFHTNAEVHGDCDQQIIHKVEELGLTTYRFYLEPDDFDPHGDTILERHEVLTAKDDVTTAARVKQALNCDITLAHELATWLDVVDPELNLWDYWIQGLKYDIKHAVECIYELYCELSKELPDENDALEHPELYDRFDGDNKRMSDPEAQPTYGWHRIDWDDWDDWKPVEKPTKLWQQINWNIQPSKDAQPLVTRINKAHDWQVKSVGAQLFKIQQGSINLKAELSEADWLIIWNTYRQRKQAIELTGSTPTKEGQRQYV